MSVFDYFNDRSNHQVINERDREIENHEWRMEDGEWRFKEGLRQGTIHSEQENMSSDRPEYYEGGSESLSKRYEGNSFGTELDNGSEVSWDEMVKGNKKLRKILKKTEVKLETARNTCLIMERNYAALSKDTERIISSFKSLEKAAKRIRSGYFRLKKILKQDSGLYRRQNHTAMKVLVEALEAYDNLRSYSIDQELKEIDDMLIQTSAPMRAELRKLIKELNLENPTEITQNRSLKPEESLDQSKQEETRNRDWEAELRLLAPASLMVLSIHGGDEESTRDALDHPTSPHSTLKIEQDETARESEIHPANQNSSQRDQASGYTEQNKQRLEISRPLNPVGSTLDSSDSDFNETIMQDLVLGPEPKTMAEFLDWLKHKFRKLVTDETVVPKDRSSWVNGDQRQAIKYITEASGALYVYIGQYTGVADLLGSRCSIEKAKLIIESKVLLSQTQPCGFTELICEICVSCSNFTKRLHKFGFNGKLIKTSCPILRDVVQNKRVEFLVRNGHCPFCLNTKPHCDTIGCDRATIASWSCPDKECDYHQLVCPTPFDHASGNQDERCMINHNYEPPELDNITSSEDESIEVIALPDERHTFNRGKRHEPTKDNATKPDETRQDIAIKELIGTSDKWITIEELRKRMQETADKTVEESRKMQETADKTLDELRKKMQETSDKTEGLRRLMQETSYKSNKLRVELFEQADEIETHVSRMKSMIKFEGQESGATPRNDDAITSFHNALNESIGHEETPHKPCVYGVNCRFLLQENCSYWRHPKSMSLPGSGRFTSRNAHPGIEVVHVEQEENVINKSTPEHQHQNKEGDITRVVSIPICMSESVTNEWDSTIENICNGTNVSHHLTNTSKNNRNYKRVIIKGSPVNVKVTRYLIGKQRERKELKRKTDKGETAPSQGLTSKFDKAYSTMTEAVEAQERHYDAVDDLMRKESSSSDVSFISSKSSSVGSIPETQGASGYCLVSMAKGEEEENEPEPGEDPCIDSINIQIKHYEYCTRWLNACKNALNRSRSRKRKGPDQQHEVTSAKRPNIEVEPTTPPPTVITHTNKEPDVGKQATHACSICDKTLASKRSLTRHMLRHEQRKTTLCSNCKSSYTTDPNNQHSSLS